MKERVISLGKALVQELGLELGVDTLSRWMAHYVAEQITIAENATDEEKFKAEQRCVETILKLWRHRSSLPDGRRPFEKFGLIFNTLDRLDPENTRPFYYPSLHDYSSGPDDAPEVITDDVQEWIDIALGIDRAARVLIDFAIKQAAHGAADEKTSSWLENAAGLTDSEDVSLVIRLLSVGGSDKDKEDIERTKQEQEYIRSKIEKLDAFSEFSSSLRTALVDELKKLD